MSATVSSLAANTHKKFVLLHFCFRLPTVRGHSLLQLQDVQLGFRRSVLESFREFLKDDNRAFVLSEMDGFLAQFVDLKRVHLLLRIHRDPEEAQIQRTGLHVRSALRSRLLLDPAGGGLGSGRHAARSRQSEEGIATHQVSIGRIEWGLSKNRSNLSRNVSDGTKH